MSRVEIHIVDKGNVDRKEVLELIHSALINAGIVKNPRIHYGLTPKEPRKFISFNLDNKVLAFLHQHGTRTIIPTNPDTVPHQQDVHSTTS